MTYQRSSYARRVFVDTSAYFALADHREINHANARAIIEFLAQERRHAFTTNFIVAETHALFVRRLNRRTARLFLESLEQGATTVVRISTRDERRAREIIFRYNDKDFSLTDATSFAVMERLHTRDVFSFDSDFEQFGFRVLRS